MVEKYPIENPNKIKIMYYPVGGGSIVSVEYDTLPFTNYLGGVLVYICTTHHLESH